LTREDTLKTKQKTKKPKTARKKKKQKHSNEISKKHNKQTTKIPATKDTHFVHPTVEDENALQIQHTVDACC
jgi:hypothetical protein